MYSSTQQYTSRASLHTFRDKVIEQAEYIHTTRIESEVLKQKKRSGGGKVPVQIGRNALLLHHEVQ